MSTLLIVWFVLSFIVESLVRATPGEFSNNYKKVLFHAATLPTVAWGLAQKYLGKLIAYGPVALVGLWFKS
jgi:hypothetical protein